MKKTISIIKQGEIVTKKEFAVEILKAKKQTSIVYKINLTSSESQSHDFWETLIKALRFGYILITFSDKYFNFPEIFSNEFKASFLKIIVIKNLEIDFVIYL